MNSTPGSASSTISAGGWRPWLGALQPTTGAPPRKERRVGNRSGVAGYRFPGAEGLTGEPIRAESCSETRSVATRANGQPALASYAFDAKTGRFIAAAIGVLTLEGALIREMTAFVSPEVFPEFNLPQELAG